MSSTSHAKDHGADYRVGYFSSTGQFSDGSYVNCAGRGCSGYSASHNVHYVRTDDGMFTIEAPISVGRTLALGVLTDGISPTIHKQWFMDQLHEGDKILFRSNCNKHNNCFIFLPDPDHEGKEIKTLGFYEPDHAKTNTQTLCGKHKLAPAVEAEVCSQEASTPTPTSTEAAAATQTAPAPPADVVPAPAPAQATKAPTTPNN